MSIMLFLKVSCFNYAGVNIGTFWLRYYIFLSLKLSSLDDFDRFLGYFQPQEGKPALWELDSDYYLHVSGIGDELFPNKG